MADGTRVSSTVPADPASDPMVLRGFGAPRLHGWACICICPFGRTPFFRFSRAAACRAGASCGAGEDPAARGLDPAGARIGTGWALRGACLAVLERGLGALWWIELRPW
ncbi:hypothetical protein NDU88_001462 [Pleurodeles waltl]|uniref:Uncharacterized protein n=1 Tax=Pleurodeles waltl TaxID=8319 RepID=A0AAV7U9E4_PLEWA|nr:hypothetical protein NDU88_001462 [Pleurodeles waltl]